MQTKTEITGYINNIHYYADELMKSIDKQLDLDWQVAEQANKIAEFCSPNSNRFTCLIAIRQSAELMKIYTKNIHQNLQTAVNCNKLLRDK